MRTELDGRRRGEVGSVCDALDKALAEEIGLFKTPSSSAIAGRASVIDNVESAGLDWGRLLQPA